MWTRRYVIPSSALALAALLSIPSFLPPVEAAPQNQPAAAKSAQLPDTPAGELARRLLEAINTGDRAAMGAFVSSGFDDEFLRREPLEAHVDFLHGIFEQSGGLTLVEVLPGSAPSDVRMRLKTKRGEHGVRMLARVSPRSAQKLEGFAVRPDDAPAAPAPWPTAKMAEAEVVREIERQVDQLASADRFSGVVLVAKGDKVLVSKAAGEMDKSFGVPNNVDTKFNLGSMNKMFTSIAIAQLVQAGKLSFDDTLAKAIPDYPNKQVAEKVTIHQMLTHTSGLGNIFKPEFFQNRDRYKNARDYFALCAADPLQFEPGTDWSYSNYGMVVLGAVVEKVSGENYYDYVREHIFEPAGMKDTASYGVDEPVRNLATGYTRMHGGDPLGVEPRRTNVMSLPWRGSAAGGGYSTAPDLLRFAKALRGHKLLDARTTEAVTSGKVDTKFAPGTRYGYGFIEEAVEGRSVRGHGGGAPGINSDLKIFWDGGYTVIVMGNYDPPAAQNLAAQITGFLARQ